MQERVARVDDERCGLHRLCGDARCPRAHGEYNVDWNLHEVHGQPRHPAVLAICKSLLDDEVLPLRVAQFSKVSPENIEMRASGTRGTDLQPTDALYPGSFLRLERGRHSEQTYAKTKNNRRPDPRDEISPSHGRLQWPSRGVAAVNLRCRTFLLMLMRQRWPGKCHIARTLRFCLANSEPFVLCQRVAASSCRVLRDVASDVRFGSKADMCSCTRRCPLSARSGHSARRTVCHHG